MARRGPAERVALIAVFRQFSLSFRDVATDIVARPERLRPAVEIVLGLILILQLGLLVWIAIGPREEPAAAAPPPVVRPVDTSIFQRFDAFFRTGAQSSSAEETATGSSQMRLFGVRAGGPDGGSAIIGLADGRQTSVGVGEEVEPGLILQSVASDHVILSRGGSVTRLVFSELPMGAATPPAAPSAPQVVAPPTSANAIAPPSAAPATGPVVDPARLAGQASLRPRMKGLGINGFTVSASGDGAALRAAGLQSGDVILSVNGTELNSLQGVANLRRDLSSSPQAEIRYERGGQVRTTTIRTAR